MDITLTAKKFNKSIKVKIADKDVWLLANVLNLDNKWKIEKFLQREFEKDLKGRPVTEIIFEFEHCLDSVVETYVMATCYLKLIGGQCGYDYIDQINRVMETLHICTHYEMRHQGKL